MLEGQTFQPNSPIGQFLAIMPLLDYEDTGAAIEALMERLDRMDGDPDLERDMSDYEPDDDAKGDTAWIEWHSRGRHMQGAFGAELVARNRYGTMLREDDEDDDPLEANGDETDGNFAEDEPCAEFALMRHGPGCIYSDSDKGAEEEGEREEYV